MAIDGISAAGAVSKSLDVGATGSAGAASATGGTNFVDALGKAFSDAIGTVQTGESAAIPGASRWNGALQGGRLDHGRAAHAAVDVGDPRQAVSAYQEISRMAI